MTSNNNKSHEQYHSRDQIVYQILQTVKASEPEGIGRLRIFYHASLSSWQLKNYIEYMLKHELITVDQSTGHPTAKRGIRRADVFHITDRGLKYLEIFGTQKELGVHI